MTPHTLGAAVLADEKKKTQRFPTSATDAHWFVNGIAPTTTSQTQKWLVRVVLGYDALGISTGPVFRVGEGSKVARARVRDLNGPFHEYLERVQDRWLGIISAKVNVREAYSFQRSILRGSTSPAQSREIPKDVVIDGNNRYRSQEAAKCGRAATFGGKMMERYTDLKAAIESLLRYSEAL
jgi:hypothetical protein